MKLRLGTLNDKWQLLLTHLVTSECLLDRYNPQFEAQLSSFPIIRFSWQVL